MISENKFQNAIQCKKRFWNNKNGQIYFIAAIVIVGLVLGFATISNYLEKNDSVRLYDLGDELKIESNKVLDYGIFNESEVNLTALTENFTYAIDDYAGEGVNTYFVSGNEANVQAYWYDSGKIKQSLFIEQTDENINVTIEGIKYDFELKQGGNFYFVLTQSVGDEKYVYKS